MMIDLWDKKTLGVSKVAHNFKGMEEACCQDQRNIHEWGIINLDVVWKQNHCSKSNIVKYIKLMMKHVFLVPYNHGMNVFITS